MADCESDRERFDITVLVVDDDTTTLSIIASILRSWEYKVATATNAHEALGTLREFRGFFDIVVTDLHMRGMNGFELQKHVKQEFQLPVIIMSADSRKSVMSKSLANGAAFYIVKPVSRDDFKDIWQYAVAGRKEKFALENNDLLGSEEGESSPGEKTIPSQDSSVLVTEPRRRKKYAKRKGPELHKENITNSGGPKRPKVVWTTSLHNRFLLAIRHIGLNKAVPKRILEIMNAPGLTRENVASHLQKYRIFLRKVAEKGILEGLSERALRSRFASGLPACLIKDIQKRVGRLRLHDHHHQRPLTITNISRPQPPTPQFPYNPSTTRPSLINEVRLGQSNHFGTDPNYKNFQQPQYHDQANHHRPILPAYNGNGGLMTSANAMIANGMISTYGSLGNSSNFNYGSTNNTNNNNNNGRLLVPFGSCDLQRSSSTYYNHFGTQLNNNASLTAGGMNQGQTVGSINNNNNNNKCSLISNGSASNNANMPVPSSVLNVCVESIQENISGLPPLNQQSINGRNAGGIEHDQYNIISSLTESETPQLNDNLTELFLMIDDMHLLNKREESPRASELSNSDIPSPFHVEECLEQFQGVDDHGNIPTSEGRINVLPNKSSTCTNENPNQLSSDDVFTNLESLDMYSVDKANSSARNSAPHEQDWDIDLIESLFGTVDTS